MRVSSQLVLVFSCILLFGCGGKIAPKPTGKVTGKITYKGEKFPAGTTVTFLGTGAGAAAGSGSVGSDGGFTVTASIGMNEISISPPAVAQPSTEELMRMSEKGIQPKPNSNLPEKYRSPSTSGMKLDVKAGENLFNFDINE